MSDPTDDTPPAVPSPRVTRARAKTVDAAAARPAPVPAATDPTDPHAPATLVVRQGGLQEAHADAIDLAQGGIGRAYATDIAVSKGGIGYARGHQVSVEMGGAALVVASEARVSQGFARNVLAKAVHVEQALVGTVVGATVEIDKPAAVGVILARNVSGDVRPLLDWRGALAFGGVIAALALVLRIGRR